MCWRLKCPFRSRLQQDESLQLDEIINILIFGVTGMTGGAVLDATLGCAWFKVSGFTRTVCGQVYDDLIAKGVRVFSGDMNKPQTLRAAMKDINTVFLVTSFWDTRSSEKEYNQGVNVVKVAIENSVKHLIYVGTDYSTKTTNRCTYLEGKALVENYIVSVGVQFTIVHLGFFYENLLSVFKPHLTGNTEFALAIPMEETPLNWGSVYDFGCCIAKIALQPDIYTYKTIKLATAYKTVSDIAFILDLHFAKSLFYNPRITLNEYSKIELGEINELTAMFAHYRTVKEWDRSQTYILYPSWRSFDQWIKDNEKILLNILTGESVKTTDAEMSDVDNTLSVKLPGVSFGWNNILPILRAKRKSQNMDDTSISSTTDDNSSFKMTRLSPAKLLKGYMESGSSC